MISGNRATSLRRDSAFAKLCAHPVFKGADIEQPLSLADAVLGGNISLPTPSGPVHRKVPKRSNSGAVLHLKGKEGQARMMAMATSTSP
jgi:DnaJ-class molecular chaperone